MLHLRMATPLPAGEPERAGLRDAAAADPRARPGPGREAEPARARGRARRLAQPRAPRAHASRLRGAAHREGAARLLRHAGHRAGARGGLRRAPRARAPRGGASRSDTSTDEQLAQLPRALDGHGRRRSRTRSGTPRTPPSTSTRSTSPETRCSPRFYRELSVNLMMQVIRGGRLEGGEYLVDRAHAIVEAFEARRPRRRAGAIRAHVASGRRIALDALERAGGAL